MDSELHTQREAYCRAQVLLEQRKKERDDAVRLADQAVASAQARLAEESEKLRAMVKSRQEATEKLLAEPTDAEVRRARSAVGLISDPALPAPSTSEALPEPEQDPKAAPVGQASCNHAWAFTATGSVCDLCGAVMTAEGVEVQF